MRVDGMFHGNGESSSSKLQFDTEQVRRYYDRNTTSFVAFGQGGSVGAIHRAVWGPGVASRKDAFHYVEDRIVELVQPLIQAAGSPHVVDLGCGVGAGLCYLAERLAIRGTGVTLSPVQARLADQRIRKAGLSSRVACIRGDYSALPNHIATADLAYAVESFVHAPDPARFFAECGRLIRPGGRLVICDDFLLPTTDPAAARAIERFRRGWRINTLVRSVELHAIAHAAGFAHESTADLSPWLEIGRPRDRMISTVVSLVRWLPFHKVRFGHLVGGSALQQCLEHQWIAYELVVFRRR